MNQLLAIKFNMILLTKPHPFIQRLLDKKKIEPFELAYQEHKIVLDCTKKFGW